MTIDPTTLRVAVVHDWLTGMRGGEKVLEAILELFPAAEIFTLFHFPGSVSEAIEQHPIRTSWLQALAFRVSDYRTLLPFFPQAVGAWDLSAFDLVVSSSHCVAKGVTTGNVPHLCYCHTPMRYIWDRFDDYFPRGRPLMRAAAGLLALPLRRWDVATSAGVDQFLANSVFVQRRIRDFYERESEVVYPFVDQAFFEAALVEARSDHHVIVSALVPYKKVDAAVEAFGRNGRRLVVIGSGPLKAGLVERAGPNVTFRGFVTEEEIIQTVATARSLIIPGVEDFGITALEALALGTPVIGLTNGGVAESVSEGCGILIEAPEPDRFTRAVEQIESREWDRQSIRRRAMKFSRARFQSRFLAEVELLLMRSSNASVRAKMRRDAPA